MNCYINVHKTCGRQGKAKDKELFREYSCSKAKTDPARFRKQK